MRIERLRVTNFRNLANVDLVLQPSTVIVGENRSGKTNLLHALRLVLDPTLSNLERELGPEDFWEGLSDGSPTWDPMETGEQIEIAVEFGGIDEDDVLAMATLGEALIEGNPMRARLVYRYAPRDTDEDDGQASYTWRILGGVAEREIRGDARRFLRQVHLHAMRDVESDITYWRRSPLKPLLKAAADEIATRELEAVATAITDANNQVAGLEPIQKLGTAITERLEELVGEGQAPETKLAIGPTDPKRLLRSLRIFVEAAARPLSTSSLGTLNVLYFALLELGLDRQLHDEEIAHVVLTIEEPEAHLHPHLQRLVFADLLRPADEDERSVMVTSHSPHIASVAPPQSLVILRGDDDGVHAAVAATAELDDVEWDDVERYLDATRGEIVFARRVLLVEGFGEQVIVPRLAEEADIDLDKEGISVCAIHGSHFATYCRYLSALEIPWAVITDGDPDQQGNSRGERRAHRLLATLGYTDENQGEHGIFVGDVSLERDLLALGGNRTPMIEAFRSLEPTNASTGRLDSWEEDGAITADDFRKTLNGPGKGRFAQRLATTDHDLATPEYIANALEYLTAEDDGA